MECTLIHLSVYKAPICKALRTRKGSTYGGHESSGGIVYRALIYMYIRLLYYAHARALHMEDMRAVEALRVYTHMIHSNV